jgi:hypothetical protein
MTSMLVIATGFIPVDRVVTMQGKVVPTVPTQVSMESMQSRGELTVVG